MSEFDKLNESLKKAGEALSGVSMQARIARLEDELEFERKKKGVITLPEEPIKVAEMLICNVKTYICENSAHYTRMFTKSDLRQIA